MTAILDNGVTAKGEVPRISFLDRRKAGDLGRAPPDSPKNLSDDRPCTKRGESGSALLGLEDVGIFTAGDKRDATKGEVSLRK